MSDEQTTMFNEIQLMMILHYSLCREPYKGVGHPILDAENMKWLRTTGMMDEDSDSVALTERGQLFVQMLVATPTPQRRWVDTRTNKVFRPRGEGEAHAAMFNVGSACIPQDSR